MITQDYAHTHTHRHTHTHTHTHTHSHAHTHTRTHTHTHTHAHTHTHTRTHTPCRELFDRSSLSSMIRHDRDPISVILQQRTTLHMHQQTYLLLSTDLLYNYTSVPSKRHHTCSLMPLPRANQLLASVSVCSNGSQALVTGLKSDRLFSLRHSSRRRTWLGREGIWRVNMVSKT